MMKRLPLLKRVVRFLRRKINLVYKNWQRYGTFKKPSNINTRKYWDNRFKDMEDFWRDEPYYIFESLLPHNSSFTLLDVGCAIGDGCEWLSQKFPESHISGADISRVAIKKARSSQTRVDYFVLDVMKDNIPGTYDYVIIVETLEHLDDPYYVVNKCLKHTNRSLFVSVPYSPDVPSGRIEEGEHVWAFNEKSFNGYDSDIVLIDSINEGTMLRIVYRIDS